MVQVDIYGDARATCTQRVIVLLEELDLKYDVKHIDLMKGEQKTKEFLELQPFGKVPVVKYDDRVLFESRSILRYIAKNNTENKDLYGGTDVDIWLEAESQNYNPPASRIVYEKVFKKWRGERADMEVVKASVEELERVLDVYEKRLSSVPYIAGDEFSIADISHIPYTNLLLKCGYKSLYKDRPNVYRWIKRIIKRESVQYIINQSIQEQELEKEVEQEQEQEQEQEVEKDLSKQIDKLVLNNDKVEEKVRKRVDKKNVKAK
jgi:glutathione S-transferase